MVAKAMGSIRRVLIFVQSVHGAILQGLMVKGMISLYAP